MADLRDTDGRKGHEADLVVAMPGAGVAVVEVKGGSVWHGGEHCGRPAARARTGAATRVEQVRDTKYAVRGYVEQDPRWRQSWRSRALGARVVLPGSSVDGTSRCRTAPAGSSPTATRSTTSQRA